MITVGMDYHVRPGKQPEFEAKFDEVVVAMGAAEGHVVTRMYRDVHDDGSYLIVSEWSDQAAFVRFIRSDAFRAVTSWGKAEILADRPRHTIYQKERDPTSP